MENAIQPANKSLTVYVGDFGCHPISFSMPLLRRGNDVAYLLLNRRLILDARPAFSGWVCAATTGGGGTGRARFTVWVLALLAHSLISSPSKYTPNNSLTSFSSSAISMKFELVFILETFFGSKVHPALFVHIES